MEDIKNILLTTCIFNNKEKRYPKKAKKTKYHYYRSKPKLNNQSSYLSYGQY